MKILKYVIGIIAFLLLAFLLLGFIKPKLSYDCEILVDKTINESWNVAQDQDKMSEWLNGYIRSEHVSGTPGTLGAVSNVYFDSNGQEMTIEETITAIEENESISMTFKSDFMDMDYTMSMKPENGKTKINSSTIARGNGIFSRSLMVLISGTVKGQEVSNLEMLKKAIEENVKTY